MLPEQQQRIMGYFIEEAKDHLNTIEQGLLRLQITIEDPEKANELFRAAHSVKGGAAMLGLESIQTTAHRMEDYFKILKESPVQVDSALETMFLKISDGLKDLLEQLEGPFGLTSEKAEEIMSEIDPVFGQLEQHLKTLVAAGTELDLISNSNQKTAALQTSFKQNVPALLRQLLTTFKQSDTPQSRQTLQDLCSQLNSIGEQFELTAWCDLSETAKLAVAHLSNEYRLLAPILIKDFKKSQDLVLAGRASEVAVSDSMQSLLPEDLLATAHELTEEEQPSDSFSAEQQDTGSTPTDEEIEDTTFDLDFKIPDLSTETDNSFLEDDLFDASFSDLDTHDLDTNDLNTHDLGSGSQTEEENLNDLFGLNDENAELSGLEDFNLNSSSDKNSSDENNSETASPTKHNTPQPDALEPEDSNRIDASHEEPSNQLNFDIDFNEIPSELSTLNRNTDSEERVDESLDALLATVNVTGPAVGEEELNSLADLFDGDLEELDNTLGGHPFVSEEMRLHPERIDMEEDDDLTDLLANDDTAGGLLETQNEEPKQAEEFEEDLFGGTLTEGGFADSVDLDWATDFDEVDLDSETDLERKASIETDSSVESISKNASGSAEAASATTESSSQLTEEITELNEDIWGEDVWGDTEDNTAPETSSLSEQLLESDLFGEEADGLFGLDNNEIGTQADEGPLSELASNQNETDSPAIDFDNGIAIETPALEAPTFESDDSEEIPDDSEKAPSETTELEDPDELVSDFDHNFDGRDEGEVSTIGNEADKTSSDTPITAPVSLFSSESVSPSEQEIEYPTLTGVKLKEAEQDIDSFFLDLDSENDVDKIDLKEDFDILEQDSTEQDITEPNSTTTIDSLFEESPLEEVFSEEQLDAQVSEAPWGELSDDTVSDLNTEQGLVDDLLQESLDTDDLVNTSELSPDLELEDLGLGLDFEDSKQANIKQANSESNNPLFSEDLLTEDFLSEDLLETNDVIEDIQIEETQLEQPIDTQAEDITASSKTINTEESLEEALELTDLSTGDIGLEEEALEETNEPSELDLDSLVEQTETDAFIEDAFTELDALALTEGTEETVASKTVLEDVGSTEKVDAEPVLEIENQTEKPSEQTSEIEIAEINSLFEDELEQNEAEAKNPDAAKPEDISLDDLTFEDASLEDAPLEDALELDDLFSEKPTAAPKAEDSPLAIEDSPLAIEENTQSNNSQSEDDFPTLGLMPDHPFDETVSTLEKKDDSAKAQSPTEETAVEDGFDDLEALLAEPIQEASTASTPATPENYTPTLVGNETGSQSQEQAPDEDEDFDDLERLLEDSDGESSPTVAPRRIAPRPARRGSSAREQNMRVPVKHLDNLSNLVGELVVSRNTLERDQERLRQFLDNLLFQVQQLNDVGQRMRDLYERSLLESSLVSNRRAYAAGNGNPTETKDHATGATFDALEMDRFTGFHTLSQEMIELIVRVRESSSDIGYTVESSDQVTRQFRQITTQLQEGLNTARMVAFSQAADRLPRAVRDISLKCGKEARLIVEGKDTLIDKMIVEHLYDPLTHLVNNAITHGIEKPEARVAAGKPAEGAITVQAFYQGNQTVIYVADDGGGINPAFVQKKAVQKGLVSQAEADALSDIETYELLFHPGFSTRDQADDFAGRGVGMDVVRTSLAEIRGVITIDSEQGKGTSFTIRLPLTLSISKALSCVSNQARIAFPMDGVEDMLDVPRDRLIKDEQGRDCVKWRDRTLPFQAVTDLLKFNRTLGRGRVYGGSQDDDVLSIIVLRSANTFVAIQVDQVIGEEEIVIKQLEGPVPKPLGIAGATILGDGRVMPIADVLELIDIAMGRVRKEPSSLLWAEEPEVEEAEAAAKTDPTVLIVDDSITVRELLSMSFNKVGYRVEQARDGQEAWDKLRSGLPCDLVFCDIEMPRMDGLELLSRMQKDHHLKQVPIAMLTSRGADRHRQMAVDLGASGYFTKPYLEEALLDAAQRMLNGETLEKGRGG